MFFRFLFELIINIGINFCVVMPTGIQLEEPPVGSVKVKIKVTYKSK